MKKRLMVLIAVCGVFFAGQAMAIPAVGDLAVDFRTWTGANDQVFWQPAPGDIIASAMPDGALLYQDNTCS